MDLDKWLQYGFSSSLLRDAAPQVFTSFTFKKVSFHFDRRNMSHLLSLAEFSRRKSIGDFVPYIKSGMRLARGSSAGATEVPRHGIGRVGSSKDEREPPCSSDVRLVELAPK